MIPSDPNSASVRLRTNQRWSKGRAKYPRQKKKKDHPPNPGIEPGSAPYYLRGERVDHPKDDKAPS